MLDILKRRFFVFIVLILILVTVLSVELGRLIMLEGQALSAQTESKSTKTTVLRGERGSIYASKGQTLAYNVPSYNIQFRREDDSKKTESWRSYYTEIMIKTIDIVERNGGKTIDTFSIHYNESKHEYYFDWGNFGVNVSDERAAELSAARENNWRKNMYVSQNTAEKAGDSPEAIYHTLRKRFYIPEEMDYQEARKLLSIWQEIQLSSGTVDPVTIAYNVSDEAVAELATRSKELDSVFTSQSTQRVYPKGELVSHIVGYMTKINDPSQSTTGLAERGFSEEDMNAIAKLQAEERRLSAEADGKPLDKESEESLANQVNIISGLGYSASDLIGAEGIEKTQEAWLTASTNEHHGKETMEVTQSRVITQIIEYSEPTDGNDIILTLDLDLQQVAASALISNIAEIRETEMALIMENAAKYGDIKPLKDIKTANSGMVVVMDVNTGDILVLYSYPTYDNNLFTGGISSENWDIIKNDTRNPLMNHAISSRRAPGSIFKMAVGLAGLHEGVITTETHIDDESPYVSINPLTGEERIKSGAPRCWVSNPSKHSQENIVGALKDSCNYFFFYVADYLEIDLLNYWAGEKFGMATKTNIELPGERVGQIGGQKAHFDNEYPKRGLGGLVQPALKKKLESILNEVGYEIDQAKIEECSVHLLELIDGESKTLGPLIREILQQDLGIPLGLSSSKSWSSEISSELAQLQWNRSQLVRTGMGQAVVEVTPIAVARYVSALVNGGILYDAHIIDRIVDPEGNVVKEVEPVVADRLNTEPLYLSKIKEGMEAVVSAEDGTASTAFEDFDYPMGGKTGTAQISIASRNIDIENTSWLVAFAPYENPEIAVVVCIPYGKSGAFSAPTVKEIIRFYMDRKEGNSQTSIPRLNDLVQ